MTSTFTVDAYINSSRKNTTSTLTWGTASYKNLGGETIDFNFKYFNSFGFVHAFEDFSEGDIVNFSGRFTYEENSAYHTKDLNISVPYVNFQCQVKPNAQQKPSTSIEGETLFIETSTFLYSSSSSPPGLHEHFFIVSIKKENKRFHSIIPKLTTFYSVSGFLRKIIKCDRKVEFLVEICSFDQLILWSVPNPPSNSRQTPRVTPQDDLDRFILSRSQKSETKRDSKRKRSNLPENTENLFSNPQEISASKSFSPDRATNVYVNPSPNITPDATLNPSFYNVTTSTNLFPSKNKPTFQAISYNTTSDGFHNLDPASFIPSPKKKKSGTITTNANTIQNIAFSKLQNNPSELEPPTRSMSGVEELIEENNNETRTTPEAISYNTTSDGFHNLDPASFIPSPKKKKSGTITTNANTIQNIAFSKLQNNPSELEPPTRSMSGVEELIEENNNETRTTPEDYVYKNKTVKNL
ncbi:hypothetical protein Glove_290g131 [Diversispora epigaea]|uniref:Uncharacterized protein n=1 Tax=Diversispora epigaea TaxID=1348612 RepID=A0A397I0J8_9GLOM|nr:hypothetical protein Glove_290g131 [Diversispora epigaea]